MDTINEILKSAEDNIDSIMQHKDNKYLRNFMEAAYLPEKKMNLPEGCPPYKENLTHEQQLRGTFWQIAKRMDLLQRTDLKPIQREKFFLDALESLPKSEAEVLKDAKDQILHKRFKGVTLAKLRKVSYFPEVVA